jgi:acetyltransferase-like isoleucine patch superfamily enzyme
VYFHFDGTYREGPSIAIGDSCFVGTACEFNIRERITIASHCRIAAGCRFIDHDHNVSGTGPIRWPDVAAEICVREYAWLGANAIVLKGVTIGRGAVVGAGAVVNRSIPDNEIWAGVPAKKIGIRR